jgi:REP element-mobilizing transposase RayT
MVLNPFGRITKRVWVQLPFSFPEVEIYTDELTIMPNHIHGIIWISDVGATEPVARSTSGGQKPNALEVIVGQYKSRVTKQVNQLRRQLGASGWQRNYYDRIIRNDKELQVIRKYIIENPLRWADEKDKGLPEFY